MEMFCQNITLTLLHSLWLVGVAAILLLFALRIIGQHRFMLRYLLSVATLFAATAGILFTYNVVSITSIVTSEASQSIRSQQQLMRLDNTTRNSIQPNNSVGTASAPLPNLASQPITSPSPDTESHSTERTTFPAIDKTQAFAIPQHVYKFIFWIWVSGSLLMYNRIIRSLVGLRRLSQSCKPIEPGPLDNLIRKTASQIGMTRRFEVFFVKTAIPSTIGFFRPILLLPLSMATGYTDDDLRCIIAHELVHIRHYDCLVNFVQLLIEGLLFFNPAIWFISRQIRLERELCCDQVALRYSGSKIDYIELVYRFLKLSASLSQEKSQPLVASFLKSSESDDLALRRVRRLALPKDRVKFRIPWLSMLLVVFVSSMLIIGISKGVDPGAKFVAKLLSPEERIETVQKLDEKYGPVINQKSPKKEWPIISGMIRTEDGSPLPERIEVIYHSDSEGYSESCSMIGRSPCNNEKDIIKKTDWTSPNAAPINRIDDSGFFSYAVRPGVVTMVFTAEGYAAVASKLTTLKPNQRLDNVDLVLTKGFDSKIKVTDSKGNPIEGAQLTGGFSPINGSCQLLYKEKSNKGGIITISHSPRGMWFRFNMVADGYEPISDSFMSLEEKGTTVPHQVTMQKGVAFSGRVLNKSGEPVSGAEFKLLSSNDGHASREGVYATTDANGYFAITQLKSGAEYLFLVRSKEYGCQLYKHMHPDTEKAKITMKQEKIVGRVTGDLDLLKRENDMPVLEYKWSYRLKGYSDLSGNSQFISVRIEGEQGTFDISEITGNHISIFDPTGVSDSLLKGPVEQFVGRDVVIELKRPDIADKVMRKVIINFVPPEGSPPPEGTVGFNMPAKMGTRYSNSHREIKNFPVKDGRVELEMPTPGYQLELDESKTNLLGYAIPSSETKRFFPLLEIPSGDSPLELNVHLEPAGMIYGRLFNENFMNQECSVTCKMVKEPKGLEFWNKNFSSQSFRSDNELGGDFALNGLPLGGEYYVVASTNRWRAFTVSQKIKLDSSNPIQKIELTIPKCDATIHGKVTDKQGNPLSLRLSLEFSLDKKYGGGGYTTSPAPYSQPNGKFQFKVAPNPPGKYALVIDSRKDFRPQRIEVNDFNDPVAVVMERGQTIEGQLLDSEQKPIPGVQLRAWYSESSFWNGREFEQCYAELPTDTKGRFRFSNLKKGRQYNLGADGGYHQLNPEKFIARDNKDLRITASPQ